MTFKRIGENMVRCILTEQDMIDNGVKIEDFFKDREKIHGFLESIVEQAREEVGYETKSGMLAMQVMPLPDKGLAITFSENAQDDFNTMLEQIKEMAEDGIDIASDIEIEQEEEIKPDKKYKKLEGRLYCFNSIDEAEAFCKAAPVEKAGKTMLYKCAEDGKYYFIIRKGKLAKKVYEKLCFLALDYSVFISDNPAEIANVQEHDEVIIRKNAIGVLKNL